jgi:hypothetical protein
MKGRGNIVGQVQDLPYNSHPLIVSGYSAGRGFKREQTLCQARERAWSISSIKRWK